MLMGAGGAGGGGDGGGGDGGGGDGGGGDDGGGGLEEEDGEPAWPAFWVPTPEQLASSATARSIDSTPPRRRELTFNVIAIIFPVGPYTAVPCFRVPAG